MLKVLNFVAGKKDSTEDMQKRIDELSILNKMSIALSSGQDLYHLLQLLLEELKKLFVMDEFYIGIYNPEAETVTFPIYFTDNRFIEINPRNLRERPGLTGATIFSKRTLYISDQNDPEVIQRYQPVDIGHKQNRSYIGIPLMLNSSVIGILSVQSALPNAYTSQQIQLLETIAAQSAIAIDKARLFSELRGELDQRQKLIAELEIKNAETETLRESVSIVAATLEKSEAVDRILDQLERVVPYNSASVQLIQDNKLVIVSGRGLNHDVEEGAWKFDINESEPSYPILCNKAQYVLYDDIQEAMPAFSYFPHNKIHSWMAVPLKIKDKLLGIIALDGNSIGQFTERHARLAVTYANHVAIALENANLFFELQRELLERERSEQALRESESKLRAIIENVPFDMWVSDRDNRYIMQSSESFRLAGDIIGKTPDEIGISPEIVAPWWEDYRRAMKGETVYKEVAWEVKGELRNFITTLAPIKDKDLIIGYIGINIDITERKRAEGIIHQREAILGAIAFAAEQFFKTTHWREKINIVLERLGEEFNASHAYLFEKHKNEQGTHLFSMRYEWAAPGCTPDLGNTEFQNLSPKHTGFERMYEVLDRGEPLIGSTSYFNAVEWEYFNTNGIKAFLEMRIVVNGEHWGTIGFDEVFHEREWTVAEIDVIKVAAGVLGAAIQRQQTEEEIRRINAELEQRVEQRTTQLQEANQTLNNEKARLEKYNRQRELMSDMTDLLQASLTMEEASHIVSTHLKLLFPKRDGALYLITPSNTFEPIAIWGEKKSLDVIYTMNECWGLRRGKLYHFGNGSPNLPCAHMGVEIPYHALCIPLSAQGESLGNLHISTQNNLDVEFISDEEQSFIETIADSLSLAIANLRLREKLHFQAIRDPLTGLFNRRFMEETLERETHRAKRSNHPLSLVMLEIDNFRIYNNNYGHEAGNYVIKKLSDTILTALRFNDFPCRYGGDEFIIILPETTIENAAHKAEDLRKTVQALALSYNNQALGGITVSMGVASFPQHGETGEAVLKKADAASYKAKAAGKNCVMVSE